MHYNCLMVDDEAELAKMTCEYFDMFGVACTWTDSAEGCMEILRENTVDILLLDINLGQGGLSQGSGFELCKQIRTQYNMPILFISARQSDNDILIALNIGGDDYVKKPYTLSVLLAKVKVMLKRMEAARKEMGASRQASAEAVKSSEENGLRLEEGTFKVYLCGREIQLKAKEFALLQCLYEHRNTIVRKEQLFDAVWSDAFYSDGTLNVHIRRLREKLEENPNKPKLIKTVWGTGYMLELAE